MPEQKIFTFDPSTLNTTQMCGRLLELTHVKNLVPMSKAMPLDRGSMLHDMLAAYRILLKLHWRGGDATKLTKGETAFLKEYEIVPGAYQWKDMVDAAVMVGRTYMGGSDLIPEDGEITINNFVEYADFYQNDGWQPLEIESTFSRILHESPELILILEGRIDLLTDSRAGKTVVDSKSAGRRQEPSLLSNQFLGYAWALDVPSVTVDKIGFQKTLKAKDRFQRYVLSYPRELKDEWREWAIYWGKVMVFYIDNGIFPPNLTSCDKYGGCIMRPICSTTPNAREWKATTLFRKGEPWSPHGPELAEAMAKE